MSESKTNDKKKMDTIYVFSENNKVYVKNNTCSKVLENNTVMDEEWFPINFQWRALMELNKNMKLQASDEN